MTTKKLVGTVLLGLCASCTEAANEDLGSVELELKQNNGGGQTQAGDEFGAVLATGNFNNDQYDDLVVGGPGEDSDAGVFFVFMGSASGIGSGFYVKQSHSGGTNVADDRFGAALATGDLNDDGFDDLVVGAPGENSDAGVVGVWLGGQGGLSPSAGRFLLASELGCGANEAGDEFGAALASGDFNNDGFDDVAIGAPGENDDTGWVCIVKGRAGTGIAAGQSSYYSQATLSLGATEAGDRFGSALATGKLTNGSHRDLAIGSPGENSGGGTAMVFFGSGDASTSAGSFFSGGVTLFPDDAGAENVAGDHFGAAVAVANLDGDSHDDLIVGMPDAALSGQAGGVVAIFRGKAGGPTSGFVHEQRGSLAGAGSETGDRFGAALGAADLDGNGQVDLVVGVPGEGPTSEPDTSGMIATFAGSLAGLEVGRYTTQEDLGGSSEAGDLFGSAIATGNFNGDGYPDLAIGAPGEAPGSDPAGGYVFIQNGAQIPLALSVGPILGAVTSSSIKVWVRATRSANYKVSYAPAAGGSATVVDAGTLSAANDYTGTATLGAIPGTPGALSANTTYTYRVLLANSERFVGTFRTLPAGDSEQITFTYGADLNPKFRPFAAADEMLEDLPHFAILGGDNVYADSFVTVTTKPGYEARYRQTFGDPSLRDLMSRVPTFMMWDDHEITNNWDQGTGVAPYPDARAAYDEYQGSHNPSPANQGQIYYSFDAGELAFFVLDTRSHRSSNSAVDDSEKTMLGETQRDALLSWLSSSPAIFKFIVSSVPFSDHATTGNDSWEGFQFERATILGHVRDNQIPGVVLLSGDQHWAGVFKIPGFSPYTFYEFMPTPMGTSNRGAVSSCCGTEPMSCCPTNIIYANDDFIGYGRFTANTDVTPATLKFDWIDDSGATQFTRTINSDEMLP
jgi:phosphodiesterase/alkaline phosphatase D-like protein